MTHDELSKKLEALWHDSFKDPGYAALRAVVELHKPYELGIVSYVFCEGCTIDLDLAPPYPCKTIESIQREINGEI